MSSFVTLTCPACGGKLQITSDIDRFACAHCGTEHVVRRGGGLVSLAPVVDEIRHVGAGVDRTASELAIQRLTKEITELKETRSSISTDRSQVMNESKALMIDSAWELLVAAGVAVLLGLVALLLLPVWGDAGWLTAAALLLAGVLTVIARVRLGSHRSAWTEHEIARRDSEIARLEQQITSKEQELRKHQELVSK